jgi:hypothetical protein
MAVLLLLPGGQAPPAPGPRYERPVTLTHCSNGGSASFPGDRPLYADESSVLGARAPGLGFRGRQRARGETTQRPDLRRSESN